jgi:ferric-dicitrate binding protein FerR (iron transport regulator)
MNPRDRHQAFWTELNALADGELDPHCLAKAAARIAEDPDAARTFAAVAALKAAMVESKPLPTRGLPQPARLRVARRSGVIAAALVLGVGLGTVFTLSWQQPPSPTNLLVPAAFDGWRRPVAEPGASNLRLEQVTTSRGQAPALQARSAYSDQPLPRAHRVAGSSTHQQEG